MKSLHEERFMLIRCIDMKQRCGESNVFLDGYALVQELVLKFILPLSQETHLPDRLILRSSQPTREFHLSLALVVRA